MATLDYFIYISNPFIKEHIRTGFQDLTDARCAYVAVARVVPFDSIADRILPEGNEMTRIGYAEVLDDGPESVIDGLEISRQPTSVRKAAHVQHFAEFD